MNLFTGMSQNQVISSGLTFVLFNGYAVLLAAALIGFHFCSRPVPRRVRLGALWHVAAVLLIMLAFVTMVWAAPAEKSFLNGDNLLDISAPSLSAFLDLRLAKVIMGVAFAGLGFVCIVLGTVVSVRQRRRIQAEA
jgi:uncharacterized membrane protein